MNYVLITTIGIIAWWIIGYKSFVYWWTKDFDYTSEEFSVAVLAGIFGPLTWVMGYAIHRDSRKKIIKPKRKS